MAAPRGGPFVSEGLLQATGRGFRLWKPPDHGQTAPFQVRTEQGAESCDLVGMLVLDVIDDLCDGFHFLEADLALESHRVNHHLLDAASVPRLSPVWKSTKENLG